MSRFYDHDEGLPWAMWEQVMARVLLSQHGQATLAELEAALLEMPEKRLIGGHLAAEGGVCAVGLYVARKRAESDGISLAEAIQAMQPDPADVDDYESEYETVDAGTNAGMGANLAWHLAFLNDEEWGQATPEERYAKLLGFVQRAQGKEAVSA